MGDFLQIRKMAVEKGRPNGEEIGVARVVDLDDTPWVLPSAYLAAANLDNLLRADDGEGHQASELGVLLNCVLIVLLDVVGEVVDGDTVVLDVLHDKLLGFCQLSGGQGIGSPDDGNNVDTRCQALHQLNVELAEATKESARI